MLKLIGKINRFNNFRPKKSVYLNLCGPISIFHISFLLVSRNVARYNFTHEVLAEEYSKFKGEVVPRDRRVSVICRNEPSPEDRNS